MITDNVVIPQSCMVGDVHRFPLIQALTSGLNITECSVARFIAPALGAGDSWVQIPPFRLKSYDVLFKNVSTWVSSNGRS